MSYEQYDPSPEAAAPTPPTGSRGLVPLVVGVALVVTAGIVLVIGIRTMVSGFPADAYVPADGEQHELQLPEDTSRGLWLRSGDSVGCELTDSDGEEIALRRPGGTYQLNEWTAQFVFDTGDGTVVVTCPPGLYPDTDVRIGPVSGFAHAMIAVFTSIVAVLVLLAGLGMVLAFTRRRRRAAPPETAR